MAYADFKYYSTSYYGAAISEADFPRLVQRASDYLDFITGGIPAELIGTEQLQKAACAVADAWLKNENGGEVASQSVGSWSVTYATTTQSGTDRLYAAARMYLPELFPSVKVGWA